MGNGIMETSLLETGNLECMLNMMGKINHEGDIESKIE